MENVRLRIWPQCTRILGHINRWAKILAKEKRKQWRNQKQNEGLLSQELFQNLGR